MRKILIQQTPFDPWSLLADYEQQAMKGKSNYGATATFIGTMRDFNEGDDVASMFLEHYPIMTEKELHRLADKADKTWALLNTLLIHRVGLIYPTDPIVLVAVWSAHRKDAFEASRFLMEELKSNVPFWKKEMLVNGSERWVKENKKGY
ncbi:MAG TPA: molybdenum cofactor biosynthesis protein MoaE [Leucothrix mucor]|uniref:Molybdopterin synthase catalytic subunit n=1 Tax=Leucothrix mucor TaxID=45248 RepID=A0A7V2T172_LEUMU|nr:molybdenum cofactor biosynthesis protein MoaE [Leucothrix mucor]